MVGVMGSGSDAHGDLAVPLGRWLAGRGVHLLTGGGGGVMTAVSRAFHETPGRRGLVIGVLPGDPRTGEPPPGYPNPWVEVAIRTHLPTSGVHGAEPTSRNHLNVLSSTVIAALPGAAGTRSEMELAVRYGRPIIAVGREPDRPETVPAAVPYTTELDDVLAFIASRLST